MKNLKKTVLPLFLGTLLFVNAVTFTAQKNDPLPPSWPIIISSVLCLGSFIALVGVRYLGYDLYPEGKNYVGHKIAAPLSIALGISSVLTFHFALKAHRENQKDGD